MKSFNKEFDTNLIDLAISDIETALKIFENNYELVTRARRTRTDKELRAVRAVLFRKSFTLVYGGLTKGGEKC